MKILIHNIHLIPLIDILIFGDKGVNEGNSEKICEFTLTQILGFSEIVLVRCPTERKLPLAFKPVITS